VSPVKYKLGFYIPEDDILHSHRHENLKSYIVNTVHNRTDFFPMYCVYSVSTANILMYICEVWLM
jgi:hypothetical protein